MPGFTSRGDMKTQVRYGVYAMTLSLSPNLALVFPLAHAGLALATSLGAFLCRFIAEKVAQGQGISTGKPMVAVLCQGIAGRLSHGDRPVLFCRCGLVE